MVNYKKSLTVILIIIFHFSCFHSAYAANNFWPWSLSNPVLQGASTVYTGTKEVVLNGVKKIATGTAIITPVAADVAKLLARGIGGLALSVAVEQLLGAVDWTLDSANNQIVYTKPDLKKTWIPKVWAYSSNLEIGVFTTANDACNAMLKYSLSMYPSYEVVKYATYMNSNNVTATCYLYNKDGLIKDLYTLSYIDNPYYDPKAEEKDDKKTLPLEAAAQQIISNAQSGDPISQAVTSSAASQIVSDAEQDNVKARPIINQLENTQSIPTDQTAKGDAVPKENANTENPSSSVSAPSTDLTLDFPIFCDWAPSVCQAAKEVISLPITLTNWWDSATTSISESWTWAKSRYEAAVTSISEFFSEETNTDTELEFNDPTDDITDTSVSFASSCPPPIVLADFNFHGIPIHWELDFTAWCDSLSTYLKPIVISMASFSAVLILGGVRENG